MEAHLPQDEAAVRAALLDRIRADQVAGEARSHAEYRGIFPHHRPLVDLGLAALAEESGTTPLAAGSLGSLGHYRLLSELGRGGQGVVYLAEDMRLQRRVALKVLSALGLESADLALRFQREAQIASRLNHPGICTIHEAGAEGDYLYIAMAFVEGETLAARMGAAHASQQGTRKSSAILRRERLALLELFEKCALALHHAHEAGVIHRDIKPTNILINPRGDPVILDFGLARDGQDALVTRTGDFLGTPAYASPEMLRGKHSDLDRRTDVYSLGVSLYEALTGRRPFEAPTREDLFQAILTREPPDPRRLEQGITADLKVVLETVLAKDVRRRYASALDLALDLRNVRAGDPIQARPVSRSERLVRWVRRAPARASLVLVLGFCIPTLAGLGGYLLATRQERALGQSVAFRSRIDRAVDRGFTALLPAYPADESAFREALELDPANLEATAGLTLQLLRLNFYEGPPRTDEALALLDRQEHRIGRHPDLLRLRLLCAEATDDAEQALALRREIGEGQSALGCIIDSSRYWSIVSSAPANREAAVEMHRLASLACDLAPRGQLFYYVVRGMAAMCIPDPEEARNVAQAILARWPGDPDAVLARAGMLGSADAPLARKLIEEQLLSSDTAHPLAHVLLGLRWWGEDWTRAAEHLEQGMELSAPNRWVLCRLGHATLELGRPEEALHLFDQAMEIGQPAPETLVERGYARLALGDGEGAEADFQGARGMWEGYYGGELALAALFARTGRLEESVPLLRRCLELDDQEAVLWKRLAQTLRLLGRDEEEGEVRKEATVKLPQDPELWNGLAWFLVDPCREPSGWSPAWAVDAAEHAIALSRDPHPWSLNTLGVALYRCGEDERALEVLRRSAAQAEVMGQPRVEDHAFIAAAASALGRLEEAEEALKRARSLLAREREDWSALASMAEAEAAFTAAQAAVRAAQ